MVILAVMVFGPWRFEIGSRQEARAAFPALAVLSFVNLQDSADEERYGQIFQDLIITDLSGMSSMKVISRQRLLDVQRQLAYGDPDETGLAAGTEVAAKAGAETMLSGNIMRRQDSWIMTCQLINVNDGAVITSHRIDGTDLYDMVDDLSGRVRDDLNLSMFFGDPVDIGVREKTTTSMAAYRFYLTGLELMDETKFNQAVAQFDSAIAVDPSFVRAYLGRAQSYGWMHNVLKKEHAQPLVWVLEQELCQSEKERLEVEGTLALMQNRFGEAYDVYSQLVRDYPDSKEAWFGLGEVHFH